MLIKFLRINISETLRTSAAVGMFSMMVLFAVSKNTFGQAVQKEDIKMPSIYLSYDSKAVRKSRCKGEEGEHVILQLHNNTDTYINVSADYNAGSESSIVGDSFKLSDGTFAKSLNSGSEVELCYDVDGLYKQKGYDIPKRIEAPKRAVPYCSCSFLSNGKDVEYPQNIGYWIKPKEYIKFGVPVRFLSENLKVYTEFSYPWEFENGKLKSSEPRHRVYFYYFDMPNYVR